MDRAVAGCDTVFAIAGTFREPNLGDQRYREVNVEAVRLMMDAARRHGVRRVVHCSTVGIHGNVTGAPASEATPIRPEGIYEITKAEGDQLALSEARDGLETVVIRPAPVYGPGDTRLVKLYKLAARDRVILLGDGRPHYHMIYIDDLVAAFRLAATASGVSGQAFIIAGAEMPTLEDVIRRIGRLTGHPSQNFVKLPAGPILLAGDLCERLCRPLGISPPIILVAIGYALGVRLVYLDQRISAAGNGEHPPQEIPVPPGMTLGKAIAGFVICAAVIFVAGPFLAHAADTIAVKSGLGKTFVGTTLVAFSTSLPELVSSIVALRMGALDLAIGNVFGSNAFNMVLLLPLDLLYSEPLLAHVGQEHAVTCMAVIMATLVAIMGQLYRSESRTRIIEPDAWLVVLIIVVSLAMVYHLRPPAI